MADRVPILTNVLNLCHMTNTNGNDNNQNNGGNNGGDAGAINVSNLVGGDLNFDGKFDPNADGDNADANAGGANAGQGDGAGGGKAAAPIAGKDGQAAGDNKDKGAEGADGKDKGKEKDDAAGGDTTTYYLDDDGNLTDAAGKIVVKKDDIKKNENGEIILPDGSAGAGAGDAPLVDFVKNKLVADFEFEFKDEKGNPVVFPDTDEGIAQLVEHAILEGIDSERKNIFTEHPRVQSYFDHIRAGGTDSTFFNRSQSWKGVTLPADTVTDAAANSVRKDIVINNFLERFGYSSAPDAERPSIRARAEKFAQMTEDSGGLIGEAKTALTDLQNIEMATEKARDEKNKQILAEREARSVKHYNNIAAIVKAGDLKGINIPATERQAFLDYVSKDVTGKRETQSMLDRKKEELPLSLQLEYMRFKGFNLDDLVKAKATTMHAQTLSARRNRPAVVVAKVQGSAGGGDTVDNSELKLSKLL